MEIKQEFSPSFKIFADGLEWSVTSRVWLRCEDSNGKLLNVKHKYWELKSSDGSSDNKKEMLNMGSNQVEEIWKYYKDTIWVSNYGYIADIPHEKAETKIGIDNIEQFKQGFALRTCGKDIKDLLRDTNILPSRRKNDSVLIDLYETKTQESLHRMIANAFLKKPSDYATTDYVVHHIDNNSYNNSVTNLIYIKKSDHSFLTVFHPVSR